MPQVVRHLLVLLALATLGPPAGAQGRTATGGRTIIDRQYEVKSKLVLYLAISTQSVDQNANAETSDAPLRIAVIGEPSTKAEEAFNVTFTGTFNGRKIRWTSFATGQEFVTKSKEERDAWSVAYFLRGGSSEIDDNVDPVAEAYAGLPFLLITEQEDKFRRTAAINFYEDKAQNRMRVQLRTSTFESHGLKPAEKLLQLPGVLVY